MLLERRDPMAAYRIHGTNNQLQGRETRVKRPLGMSNSPDYSPDYNPSINLLVTPLSISVGKKITASGRFYDTSFPLLLPQPFLPLSFRSSSTLRTPRRKTTAIYLSANSPKMNAFVENSVVPGERPNLPLDKNDDVEFLIYGGSELE